MSSPRRLTTVGEPEGYSCSTTCHAEDRKCGGTEMWWRNCLTTGFCGAPGRQIILLGLAISVQIVPNSTIRVSLACKSPSLPPWHTACGLAFCLRAPRSSGCAHFFRPTNGHR